MEGRTRRYGVPASPERTKVWVEPPPKQRRQPQIGMKVPVVYYLCRSRHLDNPHFMEVPISSPGGLYLRDVIDRLTVLRGKGMPARYSWSCKRSYKNGFVWHDLEEDDLVIPAHGNEYILKGTELLDQSPSDRLHHSTINAKLKNPEHAQQEPRTSSRTQEASSSSPSPIVVIKEAKPPDPPSYRPGFSVMISQEPATRCHPSSDTGSPGPVEYMIQKFHQRADASTQTEDIGLGEIRPCGADTSMKGVSTDNGHLDLKFRESSQNRTPYFIEGSKNVKAEISPPATSSSAPSIGGKIETLESLIRADVSKMNSYRVFDEEVLVPTRAKLKATNMFMQLITCGSVSVKDHHSFGLVPTYKPRFSHMKFPSAMISSSLIMGELDFVSEKPNDWIEAGRKEVFQQERDQS